MLNNKEIATLTNALQVPLIAADILHGREELTGDLRYALHAEISDMQPDSALLSMALGMRAVMAAVRNPAPCVRVAAMECERIIEDYADLWLQNANGARLDEAAAFEALSHAAEDLECLADMLALAGESLSQHGAQTAAALCEVFSTQAGAHALVAEEIFGAIGEALEAEDRAPAPRMTTLVAANQAAGGNVIVFPGARLGLRS